MATRLTRITPRTKLKPRQLKRLRPRTSTHAPSVWGDASKSASSNAQSLPTPNLSHWRDSLVFPAHADATARCGRVEGIPDDCSVACRTSDRCRHTRHIERPAIARDLTGNDMKQQGTNWSGKPARDTCTEMETVADIPIIGHHSALDEAAVPSQQSDHHARPQSGDPAENDNTADVAGHAELLQEPDSADQAADTSVPTQASNFIVRPERQTSDLTAAHAERASSKEHRVVRDDDRPAALVRVRETDIMREMKRALREARHVSESRSHSDESETLDEIFSLMAVSRV